ncbi:hypothetical protein JHJ32_07330 [Parapedobacter sp. ISTM3]|uniref:hypothetical protein n=1 Tax=Parapedobacter sp. ISTM3 TaxID=2800130 RepID=UPI0019035A20|nr:hypothetical protein [Parapedobacter sp. ISTM3]MBK1439789.1 hypothetical protein [Parapedobacter sp. ISTM3]
MTEAQIRRYEKAAEKGIIRDEENPIFLFSITPTKLLVKLLSGKFDLKSMARMELRNRGLDDKGKWVGFDLAGHKPARKKATGKRIRH